MTEDLTKMYDGDDLSGATAGVVYLPILRDGELKSVDVLLDEAQTGDAVFEVLQNGAAITGLDALTIANGEKLGTIADLSIELEKGDEIVLNLVSGDVSAPVTLNLVADDGQASGGGGAAYGVDAAPRTTYSESDEFTDSTLDTAWTRTTSGTIESESVDDRVRSCVSLMLASESAEYRLSKSSNAGNSDFSITLAAYIVPLANYHQVGVNLFNADESDQVQFNYSFTDGNARLSANKRQSGTWTYDIFSTNVGVAGLVGSETGKIYLHLQCRSGVYKFYASRNGIQWSQLGTTYAITADVSQFAVYFQNNGATGKLTAALDWIRRDWLFF